MMFQKTKKNKTDNSLMIVKKRMDNQTQEVRDNIYYKGKLCAL